MPEVRINVLTPEMNLEQVMNEVAKLQKILRYLLNGQIDFENIRARSIKAENIEVGTITADEIAANTITADKMNVSQLSAITANMGHLTAGKITGGIIETAAAYPKVIMDPATNVFTIFYDADTYITLEPDYLTGFPVMQFKDGLHEFYVGYFPNNGVFAIGNPLDGADVQINSGGSIQLNGSDVKVPDWSNIINKVTSQTLQGALNGKAPAFTGLNTSVSVVTSVDFTGETVTTSTLNFTNGVLTSIT